MTAEIDDLIELAYGGGLPLTTEPFRGAPEQGPMLVPTDEPVLPGRMRVTVLGSDDPFVLHSQASASLLSGVGNAQRDVLLIDLGSGALANYGGAGLPVDALVTD